jgi:NAD(P)-dependent dehydrogenase (short-subunit alcohol dehydrogenase family)
LNRAVPVLAAAAASGLALPGLFRATVAVTDDGHGIADELIALLQEAGAVATHWGEANDEISAVVYLGGLRPDWDDATAARESFHLARTLADGGSQSGAGGSNPPSFVTVGRFGRSAGPGALARTCAREWPEAAVRAIEVEYEDPDDVSRVAPAIAAELLSGDAEPDIVLRADGSRAAWSMRPGPMFMPSEGRPPIGPESVIVVTGGGRGVTAACARALASAFRPRIALIGRTPLSDESPELNAAHTEAEVRSALIGQALHAGERPRPAAIEAEVTRIIAVRELHETIADIASAGSPVRYLAADVADLESLDTALREIRAEWGQITGVVHGAGVLADRLVADKTDEQFERVMRVKAEGFRNLLDLVGAVDDPALVCAFSSVVVSTGNSGQCDYASANEIVERIALDWRAQHPDCLTKAIAWGPWQGGMVTAELGEAFRQRGIPLIPLAAGAQAFVDELSSGPPDEVRCLITAGSGGEPLPRRGEIEVSEVSQVWLAAHRVAGRAIVPLAVVCDWMLRLVPEPGAATLRDIDVVHGIVAPATVTVCRSGSVLTVTAAGDAQPHYRARLVAGTRASIPKQPAVSAAREPTWPTRLPDDGPIPDAPLPDGAIYDGETLFHGPGLQVLRRIEHVGPAGAVGELVGSEEMQWPDEPWRTDPAALDGAIQLAVVWARKRIGRATLPMFVREARFRAAGLERGSLLRCVVRAVSVTEGQSAVCDVLLTRPGVDGGPGESVLALDGLELVARPR